MKILLSSLLIVVCSMGTFAQKYMQTTSSITFFSSAPLEDIFAESKKSKSILDINTKDIVILMKPNSFIFKNPMMQEHFNEDYMESATYTKATFSGKIEGTFDVLKDGTYPVKVNGKLTMHGVEQLRIIDGNIIVKNGVVSIEAKFAVKVADHGIKVPSIQIKNIAEVVEVSIKISYKELKTK